MTIEERRAIERAKYDEAYTHDTYNMKNWRQEILRDWLTCFAAGRRYLDVGCGRGETLDIAESIGLHAHGVEIVKSMCDGDRVTMIAGAHDIRAADGYFDAVSCNDVMEHIIEEDVPAVLAEISRVAAKSILLGIARKPGTLHITIKSEEWWLEKIDENMSGRACVVFADRIPKIKQPYLWVSVEA